jgi:cation diffusion facilitator CzcD-associated flavoprotein CzcO
MRQLDVIVVGSGFGGLGMGIKLRRAGFRSFTILSRAGGVGGVWWDNRYPGAACDVPSSFYSYSFEPNYDWSRSHGTHAEIRAYLEHCVRKYGIGPHLRFDTEVVAARFHDAESRWYVRTADGEELSADVVVSACGLFNRPVVPEFPGRGMFAGPSFHTTAWDHAFDPAGKRIGVVGTGCSAAQLIPEIAPSTQQLVLFQRTPAYVTPSPSQRYNWFERLRYRLFPGRRKRERDAIAAMMEAGHLSRYEEANRRAQEETFRSYLATQVSDLEKRRKLTPDFTIGCKRPVFSTSYLRALDASNVAIVTDRIERIEPNGIRTVDGTLHELDAIVYATGFTPAKYLSTMEVTGAGGVRLVDAWRDGPEAYLGITVGGFPNFFLLYGPNTNAATSLVFMLECEIDYVVQCLQGLANGTVPRVEPRAEVQRNYNADVQRELLRTVWTTGCRSYGQTEQGKVVTQWPQTASIFRDMVAEVNWDDFVRS